MCWIALARPRRGRIESPTLPTGARRASGWPIRGRYRPGPDSLCRGWRRLSSGTRATATWSIGRTCRKTPKHLSSGGAASETIYETGLPEGPRWYDPLAVVGAKRLRELGAKYDADFVISERTDPLVKLDVVYQNDTYVIYQLK